MVIAGVDDAPPMAAWCCGKGFLSEGVFASGVVKGS